MKKLCKCGSGEPIRSQTGMCGLCYWYNRNKHIMRRRRIERGQLSVGERLIKKHGPDIVFDLTRVDTDHYWNLTTVGQKYGFTRERARQLYNQLFHRGFRKTRSIKIAERHKEISCVNDPRRKVADWKNNTHLMMAAKTELKFFNECQERGFDIKIPCNGEVDFFVNGFLVDVKSATPRKMVNGKKRQPIYHHYGTRRKQYEKTDFYACYHDIEKCFFIIPKTSISFTAKSDMLGININDKISDYYTAKNRHWEYQNAWHLLNGLLECPKG